MIRHIAVLLLLAGLLANAQNVSCLLSGTVEDPTGAVVPGAQVKVTAGQTGFVRTTRTNAEGFFSLPDLTPATFEVNISAPGFKTHTQTGIEITSSEQRSLGVVKLELGATGDSVTVTADAAQVMTASGERAAVLVDRDLSVLATRGRDLMDAVALLPGVVDLNESRESSSSTSATGLHILGGRDNQKNVTVDGISNIEFGNATSVRGMPSMESVGELKVLMSNYAAEYGRNTGGTITVITKGGGRAFHATAGFYHRHEQFIANNFFNNRNNVAKTPYRYKIFDYSISGPVTIPGKFNTDRSKLFFFFSQEIQRQLVSVASRTVTVPTALERAGDFSRSFDVNGRLRAVANPYANKAPYPGNVVPTSQISRIGQSVLNLFPMPNFVDPAPSRLYQWNFISAASYPNPRRSQNLRLDYSPRQNVQIYGRFTNYWNESASYYGGTYVTGSVNFPLTPVVSESKGQNITVNATVSLTPTLFSQTTVGLTRYMGAHYYPKNLDAVTRKGTGVAIPSWYPQNNPLGLIPNMSFGGVNNAANPSMDARISSNMNNTRMNPTFSLVENLSKIYRAHTFKFGIYLESASAGAYASNNVRGVVSFNTDSTNPLNTNYAYANAVIGAYQNYQESSAQPLASLCYRTVDWYAQDDWRVSPRLFFNYGVRFSNAAPMWDKSQQQNTFMPALYSAANAPVLLRPATVGGAKVALDPLTGTTYSSVLVGAFAPGIGNPANGMAATGTNGLSRSLYSVPAVTVAPRFGFSFDPTGKGRTVIRGGSGIFYNRPDMSVMNSMAANPPTTYTPGVYHGTLETLDQAGGRGILSPTASMYSMFGKQKPETAYNYSFGIQQQIRRQLIMDVSYVGSLARHLWTVRNINAVPMGAQFVDLHPENRDPTTANSALAANFLRPYQGWGDILMFDFGGYSSYNSLQASATRRLGGGQVAASYTFSKVLGIGVTNTTTTSPFFDRRQRNYGPLSYDRTHVLTLRYNYRLPEPGRYLRSRVLGAITDHWEISGVSRFISGAPFTPTFTTVDSANITGTPSESARPDVSDPGAPAVSRFARPARGTFGNAGVGVLRGPGVNNWDLSLYRRIPIHEGGKYIQLRIESYNTFNHTQFSAVSTAARFDAQGNQVDPLFLTPTAARAARRLQAAVRLNW